MNPGVTEETISSNISMNYYYKIISLNISHTHIHVYYPLQFNICLASRLGTFLNRES